LKERCDNPNSKDAVNYYERGIRYCDNWKTFDGFYADMGKSYRPGLSLDRIDNNKGYSPNNCRWATRKQQNNNTRRNRFITINGVTKTFRQWWETTDLKYSTVAMRYYQYGWTIEESLGMCRRIKF